MSYGSRIVLLAVSDSDTTDKNDRSLVTCSSETKAEDCLPLDRVLAALQ